MTRSIAVLGAGPGLGRAVARRYAREGWSVVLVGRRPNPLDRLAAELAAAGTQAHVVAADLSRTDAVPDLAARIRAVADLDTLYYAPTPEIADSGFVSAVDLTPRDAEAFMPLALHTLLALVQEFLPPMLDRGDGAILSAQGASAVRGLPHMSGPGPAQAAQRNYLESLEAEVAGRGVTVGRLYVGAAIENTPFHAGMERARAAGEPVADIPSVDPAHLADLLWSLHTMPDGPREITFPEPLFGR